MADSAPTLRNRKPPASESSVASPSSPAAAEPPAPPKNAPPQVTARRWILTTIVTLLSIVVFLGAIAGGGLYLYNSNPNEYFYPNPVPPWVVVPGDSPGNWTVDFTVDVEKRDAVVAAFKHAWLAYERDAMGDDEYHPITKKGTNLTSAGGIGYTVIDSLDTMLIMGLDDEYARARKWVEESLSFERDANFNTFETTIRVLGGLLSAHTLTDGDPLYLRLATDLGTRLLPVFSTASGLPFPLVNLAQRVGVPDPGTPGLVSTAEAATLQLEFRYLGYLTGREEEFWDKSEEVMRVIRGAVPGNGLVTIFMSMQAGKFMTAEMRLGSRGDSYYEYLLKQYLQTGSIETIYRDMYRSAMSAIHTNMLGVSNTKGLTYTVEIHPRRGDGGRGPITWVRTLKQDHLACFLGGSLMLGATTSGALSAVSLPPKEEELSEEGLRDWKTGTELVETCMDTYRTASGLAPEIVHFRETVESRGETDWFIKDAKPPGEPPVYDARYILRPETVESLFLAWRLTGHPRYRQYGWDIFQAIEKHCRVPSGGYASVLNVEEVPVTWEDKMETFLMSETLKYLYLLFSDDTVLPLDEYVFNTEAHPLPIFRPDNVRMGPGFY